MDNTNQPLTDSQSTTTITTTKPTSLLIINPNTTTEMTNALIPVADSLHLPNITYSFFTCPAPGIPSINSPEDAAASADFCWPHLEPLLQHHDAFLVACYSHHPLVARLQAACDDLSLSSSAATSTTDDSSHREPRRRRRRHITGIFEASVATSLDATSPSIAPNLGFGIVSTGKVWETALATAVADLLNSSSSDNNNNNNNNNNNERLRRFLGCETTGLNADQLHRLPAAEVRGKMMEATKRVVGRARGRGRRGDGREEWAVRAVCLGCAGMVGLEQAVRQALVEELGEVEGGKVEVVDGVKVGIQRLAVLAREGWVSE